jgi:hypothetical protein
LSHYSTPAANPCFPLHLSLSIGTVAARNARRAADFAAYCEMTISEVLLIEYVDVGRKGKMNLN